MSTFSWQDMIKDAEASGVSNFSPLPPGDYDFKVMEVTSSISSSNKQMFKVKAAVQGGPHHNRFVWDNLVVSPENPSALGYFFKKMKALGLGAEFFQAGPSNDQIVAALRDRTFRAKVGTRTWNGSEQNEIKEYYPAVAASAAPGGYAPQQPQAAPQAAPAPMPAPAPQAAPAPAPQAAPAPAPAPAPTYDPSGVTAPPQPPF